MEFLHPLILSVVQGLTEFLPISSSGHLILVPKLLGWPDQGLAFDAVIHLGTAAASIVYFRRDISRLLQGITRGETLSRRLALGLILSAIPAAVVGILFGDTIENHTRVVPFVAFNLLFWGVILIIVDRRSKKRTQQIELTHINYGRAIFVGLAQALALLPGTSRSGITVTAGLFQGIRREDAVKFSFLMSIPVILGAGLLNLVKLLGDGTSTISTSSLALACIGAFVSGLFAIYILLRLINRGGLTVFGIYRILLALLLLTMFNG